MALKPMSCPCHVQIFNSDLRSWRDLPVRYAEFGICHRDEPSGSMHGLLRSRGFEQDDAHVLCMPDQVEAEVTRFVTLLSSVYATLGFPDFDVFLSLRPARRSGSDEDWDEAERKLLHSARAAGLEPELLAGEGAFYGPKLEFSLKDRQGRSWQCGTIQLDMVLPAQLGASYVDQDGAPAVPLMLHHAVLGSMGRFIGILLEQHEGRLPFWLTPRQVAVIPISADQHGEASALHGSLKGAGIHSVLLDQAASLQRRLVMAHDLLVPVHAIIGRREASIGQVMLQMEGKKTAVPIESAVRLLEKARAGQQDFRRDLPGSTGTADVPGASNGV